MTTSCEPSPALKLAFISYANGQLREALAALERAGAPTGAVRRAIKSGNAAWDRAEKILKVKSFPGSA